MVLSHFAYACHSTAYLTHLALLLCDTIVSVLQGKSLLSEAMWTRIQGYESVWSDRDESDNFAQKHDVSLAKDKVRPDVMEETRLQVTVNFKLLNLFAYTEQHCSCVAAHSNLSVVQYMLCLQLSVANAAVCVHSSGSDGAQYCSDCFQCCGSMCALLHTLTAFKSDCSSSGTCVTQHA
jgi:hypothetical protein